MAFLGSRWLVHSAVLVQPRLCLGREVSVSNVAQGFILRYGNVSFGDPWVFFVLYLLTKQSFIVITMEVANLCLLKSSFCSLKSCSCLLILLMLSLDTADSQNT